MVPWLAELPYPHPLRPVAAYGDKADSRCTLGGIGGSPHDFAGLLGLIGTQGPMPIDRAMLGKSIGTVTDLDPDKDLTATLQQAVRAAKRLYDADAAGILRADAATGRER